MSDKPDWLNSLGDEDKDDDDIFDETMEDVPDWLTELGEEEADPLHPSDEKTVSLDDWMKTPGAAGLEDLLDVADDDPERTPEADHSDKINAKGDSGVFKVVENLPSAQQDSSQSPDWIGKINTGNLEASNPPEDGTDEAYEAPDWLEELGEEMGILEEDDPEEMVARPATGATDWLSDLGDEVPASPLSEATPPATETPDWLSNLGDESSGEQTIVFDQENDEPPAAEPATTPKTEDAASPAWLTDLDDVSSSESSESDETIIFNEPVESAAESVPANDMDWLGGLGTDDADTPPAETAEPADDMPDWLGATDASEKTDTAPAHEEPADDMPDWLQRFSDEDASEKETEQEDEMPDWLAAAAATGAAASEPVASSDASENIPDWLSSFADEVGDAAEQSTPDFLREGGDGVSTPADADDSWVAALDDQDDGLAFDESWMDEIPDALGNTEIEENADPESATAFAGNSPDWLGELQSDNPSLDLSDEDSQMIDFGFTESADPEPTVPGFVGPVDWSEEMEDPAKSLMATDEVVPDTTEQEMSPGDLPAWLKAMAPDDGTSPGVMEVSEYEGGEVERSGPLAGLRGLLQAEPSVGQSIRTSIISDKLTVTNAQQHHADILRRMVEEETEPSERKEASVVTQQGMMRALFAVLIILTVLFPMIFAREYNPRPALSPNASELIGKVGALSDTARVLIVFDYEPGRSAELNAAASKVVNDIMVRGTRLALVSTSPIGPAVGENFISNIQANRNYVYGENYVNLGYISGGVTGLQSFATFPKKTVSIGYDALPIWGLLGADANPWNAELMGGINVIRDFEMVMLITDNADTARNWVEQVEPSVRDGAFVMIASAQIEPMVRPFYEAGRVDSLLTSITGGASYELGSGLSSTYWNPYGLGVLIAVGLMATVGGYNLYVSMFRDEDEQPRRRR